MSRPVCLTPLPFGWYYIVRTPAGRRKLIADRAELHLFRRLLADALANSGARLHFAHADQNEIQLVLQSGERSISAALGLFFHRYASRVNRRRAESGSLFQHHGRMLLVQHKKWLFPLGRYIHWIPNLRSERVPLYWNTDAAYCNRHSFRGLVTSLTFRSLSRGSRRPRVQDQAYRAFFRQRPTASEIILFENGSPEDARILGDSTFVSELWQRLKLPAPRKLFGKSGSQDDIRHATLKFIETFQARCCEPLPQKRARTWSSRITLERVCSKSRAQPLPMIRALSASYVLTNRIGSLRQAEDFFHCRPGTLSRRRRRLYEARFHDLFNEASEQWFKGAGSSPFPIALDHSQPAAPLPA